MGGELRAKVLSIVPTDYGFRGEAITESGRYKVTFHSTDYVKPIYKRKIGIHLPDEPKEKDPRRLEANEMIRFKPGPFFTSADKVYLRAIVWTFEREWEEKKKNPLD